MRRIRMKFEKTNPRIVRLIGDLKAATRETGAPLWRDIAKRLEKPSRNYAAVNLSKINRHTQSNDTVLVAGKVLASGNLEHNVTVAALNFSSQAMSKIRQAGGRCIRIESLMQEHPKGSGIKILR
ncbi:MAG: 50S ribosomal protein L18e [Methanothrix sp.]|nr:50S ribosomal protein L18e [Methanothrix sp.]